VSFYSLIQQGLIINLNKLLVYLVTLFLILKTHASITIAPHFVILYKRVINVANLGAITLLICTQIAVSVGITDYRGDTLPISYLLTSLTIKF